MKAQFKIKPKFMETNFKRLETQFEFGEMDLNLVNQNSNTCKQT
jgi:hypothetical protein